MPTTQRADSSPRPGEKVIVLVQWALFAPLALWPKPLLLVPLVLALASAALAWRWRLARPLFLGGFVALTCAGQWVQPLLQLTFGLALGLYTLGVRRLKWAGPAAQWWRRGQVRPIVWVLTIASAALAAAALLFWFRLSHPNVDDIRRSFVPDWPTWLLLGGGVVFALVNAALEEFIYRGLLHQALAKATGSATLALVLQAVAFGLLHIHGFPRGWTGVGLATVYGLMMGGLRLWTGGLFAPWLAHVLTDVSIAAIMLL